MAKSVETDFIRYRKRGDGRALARVFDALAPQLLLIAAHVVRDRAQAEDVVQSTFLRAMGSAESYDASRPLLPWLVGILQNEVRKAQHESSRCPDPAQLKQATSDPAREVENGEMLAQLSETVESLPDTNRDVLNLRLIHGLEPREIAHSLGRSPSTVNTQLQRGMDLLRRALPIGFAGMIAAVTPARGLAAVRQSVLAGIPSAAPLSLAILSTGGGVLLMKKAVMIAVAVLFVMLALVGFNALGAPTATSEPLDEAGSALQVASSLARQPDQQVDPEQVEASRVAVPDRRGASLLVQVSSKTSKQAMGGIPVTLVQRNGRDPVLDPRQGATDALGHVRWEGLEPDMVKVRAGPEAKAEVSVRIAEGLNEVRVELTEGIRVDGLVVDSAGQPVPGAAIHSFASLNGDVRTLLGSPFLLARPVQIVTTDSAGRYRLDHYLRTGFLAATAPGYGPSPVYKPRIAEGERPRSFIPGVASEEAVPSGLQVDFEMQLGPQSGYLEGLVVDSNGEPIDRVLIDLVQGQGRRFETAQGHRVFGPQLQHAMTGADGRFAMDVPERFHIVVRAAGMIPYSEEIELLPGGSRSVEIELATGGVISGRVLNLAGDPVPYAHVRVGIEFGSAIPDIQASESGFYRIDTAPLGTEVYVVAYADHHLQEESRVLIAVGNPAHWDPFLRPMPRLRGRIVDEQGRPLVGWQIEARRAANPSIVLRGEGRRLATSEDGEFELSVHPDIPYVLLLQEPGQWLRTDLSSVSDLYGDQPPILLTVDASKRASAGIEGVLRDASGTPIAGANLQLYDGIKTAMLNVQTDGAGHFAIEPMLPRHYRLQAWGSERNLSRIDLAEFDLAQDEHLNLGDLAVTSQGELTLSIAREDVGRLDEISLIVDVESDSTRESTRIDLDSRGLGGIRLPIGDYSLSIWGGDFMRVGKQFTLTEQGLELRCDLYVGERVDIEIELTDASALEGEERASLTIQAADGNTPVQTEVLVRDGMLFSDLYGFGLFARRWSRSTILKPGSYTVSVVTATGIRFEGMLSVPDHREGRGTITAYCSPR